MKLTMLIVGAFSLIAATNIANAEPDVQAGKAKSEPCAGCHGANGEGNSSNPALAGKPAENFIQAINDFKSGKRKNAAMKAFASKLNDQDLANLAAYYASLKGK